MKTPTPLTTLSRFRRPTGVLCFSLLIASSTLLPAATLMNETFTGSTVSSSSATPPYTVTSDGLNGSSGVTWNTTLAASNAGGTYTIAADRATGPDLGSNDNALSMKPGANKTPGYLGAFEATTLAVGDTITLSFDARYGTSAGTPSARGMRFGLFNSNGTPYTSGTSDTYDDNDSGYRVDVPYNSTATAPLIGKEAGGGGSAGGGNDFTQFSDAVSNVNLLTTSANFSLSITRISLTQALVDVKVNGTSIVASETKIQDDSGVFSFDEVMLTVAATGTATTFLIDNISVITTSSIPEPSTYALLASVLIGTGVIATRRKRH